MSDYTQGVCEDGAAILKDGQPMTVEEVLDRLRECDALAARYTALADEVRTLIQDSDGLAGYHLNGEVACWSELEVGHLLGEPGEVGKAVLAHRDAELLGNIAMRLDEEGNRLIGEAVNAEQTWLGRERKAAACILANESTRIRRQAEGGDA